MITYPPVAQSIYFCGGPQANCVVLGCLADGEGPVLEVFHDGRGGANGDDEAIL